MAKYIELVEYSSRLQLLVPGYSHIADAATQISSVMRDTRH